MIRVIIEREIAEGLEEFYESAIANLLGVMANAGGYLSGESLVDIHRPNRYIVVTRWVDEAAWNRWYVLQRAPANAGCDPSVSVERRKVHAIASILFHQSLSAA